MRIPLKQAIRNVALGGLLAGSALGVQAATDGAVGFTSEGTLDIDLVVADEVRISGMSDIVLAFSGADETGASPACIYRNSSAAYQITATGDGAGGAFTLTDGGATVPYSVTYNDGSTTSPMLSGSALGAIGADTAEIDCLTAGPNATISVTVTATDAAALPAATYSGTLTLLVAPI